MEANKTNFLSEVSHEIRTPMNGIIGLAQIQLQKNDLPDDVADTLRKICNSGSDLLRVISDMLDMSKIETGKLELNPINYGVPSLIHDVMQLNFLHVSAKALDFKLEINEDLPMNLIGDDLRLKQIMNNLISSAIKYTDTGSVTLKIDHRKMVDYIELSISVKDTSDGIENAEDTVLGMSVIRQLVDLMDGSIEIFHGSGVQFTVKVKQQGVEYNPIGSEIAKGLRNFSYISGRRSTDINISSMPYGKVLIVDDVDTNLFVAEGLLQLYEIEVETASNGFAAIAKIHDGNIYDIIFMDHMMPHMDGVETVIKLRDMGYNGIIIALTANALTGNAAMFKQSGFDDFISKPIDVRHLNAILHHYVQDKHIENIAL